MSSGDKHWDVKMAEWNRPEADVTPQEPLPIPLTPLQEWIADKAKLEVILAAYERALDDPDTKLPTALHAAL